MKRFLIVFALLLFVAHLPAAAPPAIDSQGNAAITSFVKDAVARGDVPGAVVLVTGLDRILYHEAFGKMNDAKGTPMAKDAIFNIASMTKAVTSVGVMMLVEEGKLGLDDEVAKYLPQYKNPKVISKVDLAAGTYETRPATRPITIRQLLTHTSGIGYSWSDPGLALVQKKTGAADLDLPLVNEPGAQWTYGASTRVLGQVIEKI
jgi:methyl acetate hydrolase